jgi:hypothetical protein
MGQADPQVSTAKSPASLSYHITQSAGFAYDAGGAVKVSDKNPHRAARCAPTQRMPPVATLHHA